jgi:hypothetical protein
MIAVQLIACIGLILGAFILLGISPIAFTDELFAFLIKRPKSIKDEINEATKRKKPSFLRKEIMEVQDILALTRRSSRFSLICMCSLLLFAVGVSIAILMQNVFLVPVLAVGLMFLPFWYIRLTATHYKKSIAAELETALSIITTAYLRNEDILTAVEENINYLNPPVRSVFEEFMTQVKLINPNVDEALKNMKPKIENEVFQEWCDAIAACQYDRSLKTTFEPRKEFIIMELLVIGNIPVMYFLNKSWYDTLMHTIVGHVVLAICAAAIFISTGFVIKLTKPIEYRR